MEGSVTAEEIIVWCLKEKLPLAVAAREKVAEWGIKAWSAALCSVSTSGDGLKVSACS